jgi:secreted PhoX family phosphatase
MSATAENRLSRRTLIKAGVAGAATVTALSSWEAISARAGAAGPPVTQGSGFGPLAPVPDQATGLPLLALPAGFSYISYGWTNDVMSDGIPTPNAHDGMGAFHLGGTITGLVRNHERGTGTPFVTPAYDPAATGGTTNLTFDTAKGEWLSSYASLSGTLRNCAGGPTPWNTWVTCEETTDIVGEVAHGYVFEVPVEGKGDAVPLREAGRFSHEAVAIDPRDTTMYLTEDATPSGFYRYRSSAGGPGGRLGPGGTLEMRRSVTPGTGDGGAHVTYTDDTGTEYDTSWVPIDVPDWRPPTPRPALQGQAKGAAVFTRLEGAWYDNGKVYFVSTSGGPVAQGQVFEYDPQREKLRVLFASPSAAVLNAPDNITLSPRGGIVLCEDGSGEEFLHGLTRNGEIFPIARNNADLRAGTAGKSVAAQDYRGSEWAGACFDLTGTWLFACLQSPGVTFAITGPWATRGL